MPRPAKPRIEWEEKVLAGRIYITDEDEYDSSMQASVDGDEAMIHTLNGRGFFRVVKLLHAEMFPPGIKYLNFVMSETKVLKLMALMDELYNFEDRGMLIKKGRTFFKIRVSLK